MANPPDTLCTSLILGLMFVMLGACRVLLIKFSANEDGKYDYLPVTVNVCAEIIKFVYCSLVSLNYFCTSGRPWRDFFCLSGKDFGQTLKWSVPGFLYFCDNLLAFYIIRYLQPALVVLLGNFVIITTSVLYRLVLKRKLGRIQWASLVVLFLCILSLSSQSQGGATIDQHKHHAINHLLSNKSFTFAQDSEPSLCSAEDTQYLIINGTALGKQLIDSFKNPSHPRTYIRKYGFNEGHFLILIQCLLSSSANVYNEKIFKEGDGLKHSIYVQNSKLYFFGVIFNSMTLLIHNYYWEKVVQCGFFYGYNIYSMMLIFTTALYGLNVAFILKFRDNMFHILSSQLITIVVICASMYFFNFQPSLDFFLMSAIALIAIYIFNYSKKNTGLTGQRRDRLALHPLDGNELYISPDNCQE